MKNLILILATFFCLNNCPAQETVKQKNRLTSSVVENYQVLKSDDSTRNGLYQAIYQHHIAIASGTYTMNKKTGTWHFYDIHGNLVENFDYNTNKVLYEEGMDSNNEQLIGYAFDTKFTDSDHVTRPLKIGGRCYGYIPYLRVYQLPNNLVGINTAAYVGILELLISPGGRLADVKIHIKSAIDEYITDFSPELFGEEDRQFVPATLNHQPILSRIFLRCRLTENGQLDLYPY